MKCRSPGSASRRVFDSLRAMPPLSHPLGFLLVALPGWIHQQQCDAIDYLREENRVLREQLSPRRVRFTDNQRVRLSCEGEEAQPAHAHGDRGDRHPGYAARVASEAHRPQVRRQPRSPRDTERRLRQSRRESTSRSASSPRPEVGQVLTSVPTGSGTAPGVAVP